MRRSSMLQKFNGALVELVQPVISAKEADVPAIVVNRCQLCPKPSRGPVRPRQTNGESNAMARCPISR